MPTKTKKTTTVKALVTVAKFSDCRRPFTVMREAGPLKEFATVTPGPDYMPCGSDTPLRDSTARFIEHLDTLQAEGRVVVGLLADESLSMAGREHGVAAGINEFVEGMAEVKKVDAKSSGKVLAVIVTDGLENASREVSQQALASLIADREAKGWTFIYMGANQDAWSTGMSYGYSGGATGQTVTMDSSSPKAFNTALRTTGRSTAGYLADNDSYMAQAAVAPSRLMSEEGEEVPDVRGSAIKLPELVQPERESDAAEALKKAQESLS